MKKYTIHYITEATYILKLLKIHFTNNNIKFNVDAMKNKKATRTH